MCTGPNDNDKLDCLVVTFANIVVRGNGGLQREGAIVNSTMTGSAIMRCWGLAGPRVELAARRLKVVDVDCLPPTGQCPVAGGGGTVCQSQARA